MTTVRFTANFNQNLANTRRFLEAGPGAESFESLVDRIVETIVPNLERFPEMGYDLLARKANSYESIGLTESLKRWTGTAGSIREVVSADHLVLYGLRDDVVYLLSIRHHRQDAYDMETHRLR